MTSPFPHSSLGVSRGGRWNFIALKFIFTVRIICGGKFGKFAEFKALVLKLALDSTPMRMSECTGDARSMDIHARFTEATAASGERMGFFLN